MLFIHIPNEILVEIFKSIPIQELKDAKLVSKLFRDVFINFCQLTNPSPKDFRSSHFNYYECFKIYLNKKFFEEAKRESPNQLYNLKELLVQGADANYFDQEEGKNVLHLLASQGNEAFELINFCIEQGTDFNQQIITYTVEFEDWFSPCFDLVPQFKDTPLMIAAKQGEKALKIIALFVKVGANIEKKSDGLAVKDILCENKNLLTAFTCMLYEKNLNKALSNNNKYRSKGDSHAIFGVRI